MLKLHLETICPYSKIVTVKTNTKHNLNMTCCVNFKGSTAFPQLEFNDIINKNHISQCSVYTFRNKSLVKKKKKIFE